MFLWTKLEPWEKARVIVLFHRTFTAMAWFKVHAGSWAYPEPGLFKLFDVPLFSGFMYAAVGSYSVRVIRIFEVRLAPYPRFALPVVLAVASFATFFAHHFLPDIRLARFPATVMLYARTRIWFRIRDGEWWMPLPVAACLAAPALWMAENLGTATGTWLDSGRLPGPAAGPDRGPDGGPGKAGVVVSALVCGLCARHPGHAPGPAPRPAAG